ncbi:MAG TPA: ferritin-like domain-containing protein [Bryobacteraceae bacterium]|nr:ferritin-like domain-containing protein [Bryobacteraceae bacterium]
MSPSPSSTASPFERWYRHFLAHRDAWLTLPWHDSYLLTASERRALSPSIQQFQLGEWARGQGLRRRAQRHPVACGDPWFLRALELFIEEEQRHSDLLGRFLDQQSIPRLSAQWVDGVFRRLRKLAGLEVCTGVLVTAEVLAMPFYQALRDATRSPLLRSICARILVDEAAHLNYQGMTLGLIRRRLSDRARVLHGFCHRVLFNGTALLLWQQHGRVFRSAGWSFFRFWSEAQRWFAILEMKIRNGSLAPERVQSLAEARLD